MLDSKCPANTKAVQVIAILCTVITFITSNYPSCTLICIHRRCCVQWQWRQICFHIFYGHTFSFLVHQIICPNFIEGNEPKVHHA